ncbi:aminotransferase class I/II-fold pyridoxal phosphate-dependent enzyme [Sphingomonas sp.]|uniref:aminotransferase class I/II-fold pyridoxal phosphate-dependent enzyme n=1 Tax=Sphingomonas sp. TaxID=28214 RepID=UPI0025E596DC|nr:aminotransferase class I/II-fold pyridoxal phosphate-dependent enzyme [Sphingomonas sp.]
MKDLSGITTTRVATIRDALAMIDGSGHGLVLLIDAEGRFERTVTDGDLRRLLLKGLPMDACLTELPTLASLVINERASRRDALELMDQRQINHLPVVNDHGQVVRVIERRDIEKPILLSTPHMGDTELAFVEEAFRTNWIAPLGPNVDAFERTIADMTGVSHAAALSSGTAAIHLAMVLLGVGAGDTVFCSSFTFAASANPIVYQGAIPVFIDCEDSSWNMCPKALERSLAKAKAQGKLPKAVIVVNLYGQSADMDPILALCDAYGIPVVEDAAESLGATYKGRQSGSFGKLAAFSFNGNKIITTSGGGMLLSDDGDLIARARFLSTQARDPAPHYEHSVIGYNYRMSNILAGVGRGQLQVLDERIAKRRAVFQSYVDGLEGVPGITWMPEPAWSFSTRWLSTCTIDPTVHGLTAKAIVERLAAEMIEARPLWKPMHRQPVFAGCDYVTADNESVCDRLFDTGLCLPSGSNMSTAEVDRVINALRNILGAK